MGKEISGIQKGISLVLKAVVITSAVVGTLLSYLGGRNTFMGGKVVFMYFTIQSNVAIAAICAIGLGLLLKDKKVGRAWYVIKFIGTVSITLTGMVFGFVLAPTMGAHAWNVQNVLTHVVVPVAAVIDYFITYSPSKIRKADVFLVTIPPSLYAIYAGIGFVQGWQFAAGLNYPYFFLNWGSKAGAFGFSDELPFMGCAWWILALLLFLVIVGYGYLLIADAIHGKKTKQANK